MSEPISVQLDVLGELLVELRLLGAELTEEGLDTTVTAGALAGALAGPVGADAALAGQAWSGLITALATRTTEVAGALDAALIAYRAADLEAARHIAGGLGPVSGPLDPHAVLA